MLHFSIALSCEAKGIIHHYGMKPCGGHGRAQFFEGENTRLAVTGIGSLSSAIATTAFGMRFPDKAATWLNVGVCGHRDAAIGEAFVANRISSETSRDRIYPQLPWKSEFRGIDLLTLTQASNNYRPDQAFDMEGFGFYKAALAFTSTEFVQCIKIVSDNAANPATDRFDPDEIARSIENKIPEIEALCSEIEKTRPKPAEASWSTDYIQLAKARFDFTETESHQVRQRISKLSTLLNQNEKAELASWIGDFGKKNFLKQLQFAIDQAVSRSLC